MHDATPTRHDAIPSRTESISTLYLLGSPLSRFRQSGNFLKVKVTALFYRDTMMGSGVESLVVFRVIHDKHFPRQSLRGLASVYRRDGLHLRSP